MKAAKRLDDLGMSKIRLLSAKAQEMRAQGRQMYMFTMGQPDFATPRYIIDACEKALEDGFTTYPAYEGPLVFRQAVCDKYERENSLKFDEQQVISTCGAAQAAYLVLTSFLNPGDEVLIPNPMYNIYEKIAEICGAAVKTYALKEENDFQIDLAELEKLCFSEPWSEKSLTEEIDNPAACFLVAMQQDEVLGYGGMHTVLGESYVDNIAVFPEFRGHGVGRTLMAALIEKARENGGVFITLEVRTSNLPAIAMYRSLGFTEAGVRRNFYTEPREDALIFTLSF